jgi:hypothetical protein
MSAVAIDHVLVRLDVPRNQVRRPRGAMAHDAGSACIADRLATVSSSDSP